MATLRTMNRRRRMRHYENYVVGVYASDADGNMRFFYEKAVAGRWQRFTPRGQVGALAAYSENLGSIEISEADMAAWMAQFEDGAR